MSTVSDFRIGDYVRFEKGEWSGREGMITTLAPDFLGATLNHTIETRQFQPNELTILYGDVDWCSACHTRQPKLSDDAEVNDGGIICFECGHVYVTAQALLDAWNAIIEKANGDMWKDSPMPKATNAEDIAACPCCTHDF